MSQTDILVGLVIAGGLVGILVPVLPGGLVVLAAIVAWGLTQASVSDWTVVALASTCLVGSQLLKYLVPGRRLRDVGVPGSTLAVGALLAIAGFFLVPVVGVVLGFVAGVYAAERRRLHGHAGARTSTANAIRAVGLSMVIEMSGALAAAAIWFVGALTT